MVSFVVDTFKYIFKMINDNQLWSGILLGWFFTRIMEILKRPSLSFSISDDKEFTKEVNKFKFLNIVVRNNKRGVISKFLFGNTSLNNARVWVKFLDVETKAEMLKINGRWASTKEPVDYQSGQPLISDILIPSRESIPPGEEVNVSVAIKQSGVNSFFAFNNDSYLYNWTHPDYELDERKYFLKIDILADGSEYSHQFCLINPPKNLRFFKIIDC